MIDFEEEWDNVKHGLSTFFKCIFFKSNVRRLIEEFEGLNSTTFRSSKDMLEAYNSLLFEVREAFTILNRDSRGTFQYKRNMNMILSNLKGELEEIVGNIERDSHVYKNSEKRDNSQEGSVTTC